MTPYRARPPVRLARISAQLATVALGLGLSFTLPAQDSNSPDCAANTNAGGPCGAPDRILDIRPAFVSDWVPLEAVPESLRDRECLICGGRYIDPLAGTASASPPEKSDIRARADRSRLQGNDVVLTGEAIAVQGYRHMRSDQVTIDREKESAALLGNVTIREPGVLLEGESARIYSRSGEAEMRETRFTLHQEHMRGTASVLERDAEGMFHVHDGVITYCPPGENDWAVVSRDMDIDMDEGLATLHHARVEVEDIPVFYTPWLRLPLDDRRRTGLLWPDFGNDSSGGLDVSVPVYLNLAPNYDALYAPRFIEERGLDHEVQLRYLNPLVGEWLAGGAFLKNDSKYRDQAPTGDSADRWLGIVRQNGLFEQRWRSRIDYSKASDVDYMRDLQTTNLDSQRSTSLLQMASLDYLGDRWLMNLRAQQFQSLADDIKKNYEELPQFTGQYRSDGTPFALEPILLAQYSNFGAEEDIVTGQRLYGEAGVSYPMLWRFGSLQPTVKYRQVDYALSESNNPSGTTLFTDDSPSAGAPLFNVDGSLIFERETSIAGKHLYQTLEPRLYYLYSEEENQDDQPVFDSAELTFTYYQLFRETRFSGYDRLDDANQVSAGLTSRYIDDATGRDLASASIGQIYYFEDRNVRLLNAGPPVEETSSEIAGELAFAPTTQLGLRSSMVWDPHKSNLDAGFVEGSYRTDDGGIFNLGYSYRRYTATVINQPQTEEASASGYLPLDNNWSIFAAMNYSIEDDLSVEDMVGVEYDTCCWTVRMLQLRYYNNVSGQIPDFSNPDLERETTVQFQFLLKGMGGFGNRITNIMQHMIRGFEERGY